MIEALVLFVIATIISFAGSLQPGPVNLAVIHTSLQSGIRKSMLVAVGGILPELIYSSLAIWLSLFIIANEWLNFAIRIAAIAVFASIGIIFILKKEKPSGNAVVHQHKKLLLFGFLAGIFNPLMFPFWLMIVTYINNSGYVLLDDAPSQIAFVAGTAAGALLLLYIAAHFAIKQRERIFALLPKGLNTVLGSIFIVLSLWEGAKLMFKL